MENVDDVRLRPVNVGRQFHRSPDWVRSLERRGVIPPAPRDFSGRRYYRPGDIAIIRTALEHRRAVLMGSGT